MGCSSRGPDHPKLLLVRIDPVNNEEGATAIRNKQASGGRQQRSRSRVSDELITKRDHARDARLEGRWRSSTRAKRTRSTARALLGKRGTPTRLGWTRESGLPRGVRLDKELPWRFFEVPEQGWAEPAFHV